MSDISPLEMDFHKEMLAIYRNAKEGCGYNATRFRHMVANEGGLKTAKKLLATSEPSDGFTALWECGRLDLTVECLIIQPKYQSLFSSAEISIARERLSQYGFKFK